MGSTVYKAWYGKLCACIISMWIAFGTWLSLVIGIGHLGSNPRSASFCSALDVFDVSYSKLRADSESGSESDTSALFCRFPTRLASTGKEHSKRKEKLLQFAMSFAIEYWFTKFFKPRGVKSDWKLVK